MVDTDHLVDNTVSLMKDKDFVSSLASINEAVLSLTGDELKEKAKSFWAKLKVKGSDLKKKVKAKMSD